MFSYSTFIFTYQSTDKVIRIVDTTGRVMQTISVCRYQKSGVVGSTLSISLEDNDVDYKIPFESNANALLALGVLKQAIDTLKPNCTSVVSGGGAGGEDPIAITLAEYIVLQTADDLLPMQWYDISDTGNDLLADNVYIFRVLAKTTDDAYPAGQIINNLAYVTLDVLSPKITHYFDPINNIEVIGDYSGNSFVDTTDCFITNNSKVTAVNCSGVTAENGSVINCNTVNVIKATNNSNITIQNATNVSFNNIQQNITTTSMVLSDVDIDRNTSKGKAGETTRTDEETFTLSSYRHTIDNVFAFTVNESICVVKLQNLIHQANGLFNIRMGGAATGCTVQVIDADDTVLYEIVEKTGTAVFEFNINTQLFEFRGVIRKDVTSSKTVQFLTPTLGQVNFTLGVPVTQPLESEMFINGAKQIYGVDYSYNSTFDYMTYSNVGYTIETTDRVEFRVS